MKAVFLVMAGGAIGAGTRYGVSRAFPMHGDGWPWATFVCNIVGGFAMGLLISWLAGFDDSGEDLRLLLGVGVLGGFTTFSAFSAEMMGMIERGQFVQATLYAALSVVLSIVALFAGLSIMRSGVA